MADAASATSSPKGIAIMLGTGVALAAGAQIAGQPTQVAIAFGVAGLVLGSILARNAGGSSSSSGSKAKAKPKPVRASAPAGSGNAQFAVMIWFVNVLIAGALMFFAWKFLLTPPSPAMPSYVPMVDELPGFEAAAAEDWEDITWTRTENVKLRDVNAATYLPLHDAGRYDGADWNRRQPFPMPTLKPKPQPEPEPEPEDPTEAEALADLQQKLVVKAFMGPSHVVVAPKGKPTEEYMLVGPARWAEYLAQVQDSSSRTSDFQQVRGMLYNDLEDANLPLTVVSIGTHSWAVDYTFKNKTFRLSLGPPRAEGTPDVNRGDSAPRTFAELINGENGGRAGGGSSRPGPGGSGRGTIPTPEPAPQPGPEIEESYEESPGVWVIAPGEVNDVRENMSGMIEELKPKSVFNRETREYEGIQMTNVPEESLARRRGFVPGDTIISINGVPVRSVTDVKNYVRNNKNLPQYVVVFDRGGERRTRTFRIPQNK